MCDVWVCVRADFSKKQKRAKTSVGVNKSLLQNLSPLASFGSGQVSTSTPAEVKRAVRVLSSNEAYIKDKAKENKLKQKLNQILKKT